MLTIFTTAKPFVGHSAVVQQNALRSWVRLDPQPEILLFGDDSGSRDAAALIGARHVPELLRHPSGAKRADDLFRRAQQVASYERVCYVSADIILMSDFMRAVRAVAELESPYLMVARRWGVDIQTELCFTADWEERLTDHAKRHGQLNPWKAPDFFLFRHGTLGEIPPFIFAAYWDNWMLFNARARAVRLIDATPSVVVVHQNHDYSYHPDGWAGIHTGPDAMYNLTLAGRRCRFYTTEAATHRLVAGRLKPNILGLTYASIAATMTVSAWRNHIWFPVLDLSRPLRHPLGLRKFNRPSGFK